MANRAGLEAAREVVLDERGASRALGALVAAHVLPVAALSAGSLTCLRHCSWPTRPAAPLPALLHLHRAGGAWRADGGSRVRNLAARAGVQASAPVGADHFVRLARLALTVQDLLPRPALGDT